MLIVLLSSPCPSRAASRSVRPFLFLSANNVIHDDWFGMLSNVYTTTADKFEYTLHPVSARTRVRSECVRWESVYVCDGRSDECAAPTSPLTSRMRPPFARSSST